MRRSRHRSTSRPLRSGPWHDAAMPTPLEVVRDVYAAMAAKDVEGVLARCHPDVVITQDTALPWGGHFVGADGVAEFAIKLVGAIDSAVTPIAMFQADNDVV